MEQTTTLYVVRHAEAEGNLYRRIHGWYDALITENGYRQIAALEERFRPIHIDAVYSSDLFRTRTTARAVYPSHGLTLTTRPDLREVSMGEWEDRTWGEVARFQPAQYLRYSTCDPHWKNRGGESRQEARVRIMAAMGDIAAHHPGQTVAVFCHGDIIRCLHAEVLGIPVEQMTELTPCDNTGVSCFRVTEGRFEPVFRNDASHLPPELSTMGRQRWWKEVRNTMADANCWFRPLTAEDESFYRALHRGTWTGLYGPDPSYDDAAFFQDALRQVREDRRAVSVAMLGDAPVGMVHLDLERDRAQKAGHIRFFALAPEHRGRGLAPQLLGQAVSVCRPMGRDRLRLLCSPENEAALRFYGRHGFYPIGTAPGRWGPLHQLEKYIGHHPEHEPPHDPL